MPSFEFFSKPVTTTQCTINRGEQKQVDLTIPNNFKEQSLHRMDMLPSKNYDYGWIKGYKVQYTMTVTSVHKHKVRACCIVYNTHAERSCLAMAEWVMFEAAKELHIYINLLLKIFHPQFFNEYRGKIKYRPNTAYFAINIIAKWW